MILAAFRVRSFRFQWPADLLTSLAFEMETIILGWYVMVQTGSVLLLTVFGSLLVTGFYGASLALTLGVARRRPVPDPGEAPRAVSMGVSTVATSTPSRGRALKDGLLHVLRTPELLAPMWLAFLINLTAYPASNGLLPYVAKNV